MGITQPPVVSVLEGNFHPTTFEVPKCFKPGHIDPHDQTTVEGVNGLVERKRGGVTFTWWYQWGVGKVVDLFLGGTSYVCVCV